MGEHPGRVMKWRRWSCNRPLTGRRSCESREEGDEMAGGHGSQGWRTGGRLERGFGERLRELLPRLKQGGDGGEIIVIGYSSDHGVFRRLASARDS